MLSLRRLAYAKGIVTGIEVAFLSGLITETKAPNIRTLQQIAAVALFLGSSIFTSVEAVLLNSVELCGVGVVFSLAGSDAL